MLGEFICCQITLQSIESKGAVKPMVIIVALQLTITVDDETVELYVDGVLTSLTNADDWRDVDTINIPDDTRVIAIRAHDNYRVSYPWLR